MKILTTTPAGHWNHSNITGHEPCYHHHGESNSRRDEEWTRVTQARGDYSVFAGKCLSGPGQIQDGFEVKFVVVHRLDLNGSTITVEEDFVHALNKAGGLPEDSFKVNFITALHIS